MYLGVVGARLERAARMEAEYVLRREQRHRQHHHEAATRSPETSSASIVGSDAVSSTALPARVSEASDPSAVASRARMWAAFLGLPDGANPFAAACKDGDEGCRSDAGHAAASTGLLVRVDADTLFDVAAFKRRMRVTADTVLIEANARAQMAPGDRRAFVHFVGLGLGVWGVHPSQPQWLADAIAESIEAIRLPHVAAVDLSWFRGVSHCGQTPSGSVTTHCTNGNRIRITVSKRNPADPLNDPSLLLVATYAWDGNSFPGNEFWMGSLTGSGDPAAICCSTLAELQNPLVNDFAGRIAVLDVDADGMPVVTEHLVE